MAEKPVQNNPEIIPPRPEPDLSPEGLHRRKLIEEERERKKKNVVVETWLELYRTPNHPKGDKVRLCKRVKNGSVYRTYLGRSKQCGNIIAEYRKKKVEVKVG